MRRLVAACMGILLAFAPVAVLAEGVGGYSRGNAFMYFAAIGAVLIYGIHDIFRNRWVTIVSAIIIPTALYLNLPAG
ncbi:MAG: hypothetical protein ACREI3_03730 [Nitrospirales bacterium]